MAIIKKQQSRLARKARIRKQMEGSPERPRLSIFKSSRFIYAQIVNDVDQKTLVACSSAEKSLGSQLKSKRNVDAAKQVGKTIAQRAKEKKITNVVFDRNGYVYHGRVQALAE